MATGTVKWFNEQKGYGFIQPDQGGKDVFVHISAVERSGLRSLADGQKVSYDVEADRRTGKESAANLGPHSTPPRNFGSALARASSGLPLISTSSITQKPNSAGLTQGRAYVAQ